MSVCVLVTCVYVQVCVHWTTFSSWCEHEPCQSCEHICRFDGAQHMLRQNMCSQTHTPTHTPLDT